MQYAVTFLEGIVTFISPCLLPMLPIYLSYFAGGRGGNRKKVLANALGFILGFTLVFLALGAFAGTTGMLLRRYQTVVNLLTGGIVVLFGLQFMGVLRFNLLNLSFTGNLGVKDLGFASSLVFGMAFSISWTPCVSAFLGAALMLAMQGSTAQGMLLLLCYSLGLGIPFLLSALLIDRMKSAFDLIKRHYGAITKVCGALLVAVGILMMSGMMGRFLSLLA